MNHSLSKSPFLSTRITQNTQRHHDAAVDADHRKGREANARNLRPEEHQRHGGSGVRQSERGAMG